MISGLMRRMPPFGGYLFGAVPCFCVRTAHRMHASIPQFRQLLHGAALVVHTENHLCEEIADHLTVCNGCGAEWIEKEYVHMEPQAQPHEFDESGACNLCGFRQDQPMIMQSMTAAQHVHSFAGGICSECNYECEHEDTDSWEAFDAPSYQQFDGRSHKVTGRYCVCTHCNSCGIVTSEVQEENITEQYWHDYDYGSDACRSCGYVNICEHENSECIGEG